MAFCKHCGAEIPEIAKFCPKCGTADPVGTANIQPQVTQVQQPAQTAQPVQCPQQPVPQQQNQQSVQPVSQQQYRQPPAQPKPPKKPVDFTAFNRIFFVLYVIVGLTAVMFTEVCVAYVSVSQGFCITLGVIALICGAAFCALGIVRFIASFKESKEDRKKNSTRYILILAISIIVLVFVVLTTAAMFDTIRQVNATQDSMNNIFGNLFN